MVLSRDEDMRPDRAAPARGAWAPARWALQWDLRADVAAVVRRRSRTADQSGVRVGRFLDAAYRGVAERADDVRCRIHEFWLSACPPGRRDALTKHHLCPQGVWTVCPSLHVSALGRERGAFSWCERRRIRLPTSANRHLIRKVSAVVHRAVSRRVRQIGLGPTQPSLLANESPYETVQPPAISRQVAV